MSERERETDPEKLTALLATEGELDEEQAAELAEKDFEGGFAGSDGLSIDPPKTEEDEPEDNPEPADNEDDPEPEPAPEAKKPEAKPDPKDDVISQLQTQIRSLQGKFGELNSRLQKQAHDQASVATKAQGAKTPTKEEVMEAFQNEQKLQKLKEDFPEYGEALEAQARVIESKIAQKIPDTGGFISKEDFSKALDEVRTEARAYARLDNAHPGWDTTIAKPEFAQWLSSQDDKIKALSDSNDASDAISLLDKYEEYNAQQTAESEAKRSKESSKRRLESAVAPTSRSTVAKPRPMTDEELFEEGFKTG